MDDNGDTTERRLEDRRPLGISQEFEDALSDVAHRRNRKISGYALYHVLELFWKDIAAYAVDNGRKIDRISGDVDDALEEAAKTIKRLTVFIVIGAFIIAVLTAGIGVVTVISLGADNQNSKKIQASIQTSRYDGAYRSCEATNERHTSALRYVSALSQLNPAAGIVSTELLNALAPLRNGTNGSLTCAQYAAQQTALSVPSAFNNAPPPPAPVTSTTPTTTTSPTS